MQSERVYQIRRAILKALKDYSPASADPDEIQGHPSVMALNASSGELVQELNALSTDNAYVTDIPEFNGRMKRINQRGLKQLNQEGEREIFIWGKYGTKG